MSGMFGRSAVLLATMVVALVLPVLPTASAAPDPYPPKAETQVHVSVKARYNEGVRVKLSVRVSVNGNVEPTGEVRLSIGEVNNGGGGRSVARALAATEWSTTVRYEGSPIKVTATGFDEGSYLAKATFVPDSPQLRRSTDSETFVVADGGPGDKGTDPDSADGLLPDTGGPSGWWLLAGLVLVGGGAGLLVFSRRRRSAAPHVEAAAA